MHNNEDSDCNCDSIDNVGNVNGSPTMTQRMKTMVRTCSRYFVPRMVETHTYRKRRTQTDSMIVVYLVSLACGLPTFRGRFSAFKVNDNAPWWRYINFWFIFLRFCNQIAVAQRCKLWNRIRQTESYCFIVHCHGYRLHQINDAYHKSHSKWIERNRAIIRKMFIASHSCVQ